MEIRLHQIARLEEARLAKISQKGTAWEERKRFRVKATFHLIRSGRATLAKANQ